MIRLGNRSWSEEGEFLYQTQILLAGCQSDQYGSEIEVILPETISEDEIIIANKTYNNQYLTLVVELKDSSKTSEFDDIILKYPLGEFSASVNDLLAQKTPIKIEYTPSVLKVSGNQVLGMKFDSYVTPIDLTSLQKLPIRDGESIDNNTKKYTIFTKDNVRHVCPAMDDDICWIPVGVTQTPGVWNVSFVVKNESYTYYMEVLKLPVKDNILSHEDLDTDALYSVVRVSDGSVLYEKNSKAVYAIAQNNDRATLDFTKDQINSSISWVNYIISQNLSEQEVVAFRTDINTLFNNQTTISSNLDTTISRCNKFEDDIKALDAKDSSLAAEIARLGQKIDNADTTILADRLDLVEYDVDVLGNLYNTQQKEIIGHNKSIDDLTTKDYELETAIKNNAKNISDLSYTVNSTHSSSINDHKTRIEHLEEKTNSNYLSIIGLKGVDEELKADIAINTRDINELSVAVSGLVESDKKYWTELNNETAVRATRDAELQKDIDDINERFVRNVDGYASEVVREAAHATEADNSLKLGGKDPSYYATQESYTALNTALQSGAFKVGQATNAELLGGKTPEYYAAAEELTNLAAQHSENVEELNNRITDEISAINNTITEKTQELTDKINTDVSALETNTNTTFEAVNTEIDKLNAAQDNTTQRVDDLNANVVDLQTTTSIVRNDSFYGVYENYVAKIVVIEDASIEKTAIMAGVDYSTEAWVNELVLAGILEHDADLTKNLTAEQVYDALKLKGKIEANTLYLLREEE